MLIWFALNHFQVVVIHQLHHNYIKYTYPNSWHLWIADATESCRTWRSGVLFLLMILIRLTQALFRAWAQLQCRSHVFLAKLGENGVDKVAHTFVAKLSDIRSETTSCSSTTTRYHCLFDVLRDVLIKMALGTQKFGAAHWIMTETLLNKFKMNSQCIMVCRCSLRSCCTKQTQQKLIVYSILVLAVYRGGGIEYLLSVAASA